MKLSRIPIKCAASLISTCIFFLPAFLVAAESNGPDGCVDGYQRKTNGDCAKVIYLGNQIVNFDGMEIQGNIDDPAGAIVVVRRPSQWDCDPHMLSREEFKACLEKDVQKAALLNGEELVFTAPLRFKSGRRIFYRGQFPFNFSKDSDEQGNLRRASYYCTLWPGSKEQVGSQTNFLGGPKNDNASEISLVALKYKGSSSDGTSSSWQVDAVFDNITDKSGASMRISLQCLLPIPMMSPNQPVQEFLERFSLEVIRKPA